METPVINNKENISSSRLQRWTFQLWRMGYYLSFVWDKLANRWGTLDDPMRTNFYLNMWQEAANQLSVKFELLPDGFCEASRNGRVTRIYQNLVMLDHPVTMKLSRTKPLVLKLLDEHGVHVPAYREFTLQNIQPGLDFLREQQAPCVVKPARGTAGGEAVTTNVKTPYDLKRAAIYASLYGHTMLIERQIPGDSYRLLYLNGKLIDAICRKSPSVTGDGKSTIKELIKKENSRRAKLQGTEGLTWLRADVDCRTTLQSAGLTLDTVPREGAEIVVKQATNDNSAQENKSITPFLCDDIVKEGARACDVLGIRLAGVDILATDHTRPLAETGGVINEVNTTPGLHYHYQINNPEQGTHVIVPILQHLLGIEPHTNETK